jgi:siroheme decarboxylase
MQSLAPVLVGPSDQPRDSVDHRDLALLHELREGLPLVPRPYAAVADRLGLEESEVIRRLTRLQQMGVIKRFGVIVRHHELGYRANAMVVWQVPDHLVDALGRCLSQYDFITLCYRRESHPTQWPYNLYCMIHGKDRGAVLEKIDFLISHCRLEELPRQILFSRRRFKQCGANYRRLTHR